jgi:2-polyprenyl-6-methoxyphenol hydroxylase-like FAD-dependent oxidoreductase
MFCRSFAPGVEEIHARLVVCADGRGSVARKWLNFPVQQESHGMLLAGVLCEATPDSQELRA